MYSQHDEENIIVEKMGNVTGKFIDIGAYDGKAFSNTLRLLELGWSGVMVEPSPGAFLGLIQNTAPHWERVELINAAITVDGGLREWWDFGGDAIGTLDVAHRDKWQAKISGLATKFLINTLGAAAFFKQYGPASFINLDVEGCNWELFQRLPFTWPQLVLICVEFDDKEGEMVSLAVGHGFRRIHATPENLILAR